MTDTFELLERGMAGPMDRRRFLQFTGALAGAAAFCQLRGDLAHASRPLGSYPFTLGVASGDPSRERGGAVDAARPEHLRAGRRHAVPAPGGRLARWPRTRGCAACVRRGTALARAGAGALGARRGGRPRPGPRVLLPVQVPRRGEPRRAHDHGARRAGDSVRSLAFAFASCQAWDDGYYSAYRRMAEEDLAFVVHLGDYLYEYGIDEHGGFRNVPVPDQFRPECVTLERYRLQYALYKSDPDLQARPPALPLADRLGRPRGPERLRRACRPRAASPTPPSPRGARPPTRRSTSTSRCGPTRCRGAARRGSTGG